MYVLQQIFLVYVSLLIIALLADLRANNKYKKRFSPFLIFLGNVDFLKKKFANIEVWTLLFAYSNRNLSRWITPMTTPWYSRRTSPTRCRRTRRCWCRLPRASTSAATTPSTSYRRRRRGRRTRPARQSSSSRTWRWRRRRRFTFNTEPVWPYVEMLPKVTKPVFS